MPELVPLKDQLISPDAKKRIVDTLMAQLKARQKVLWYVGAHNWGYGVAMRDGREMVFVSFKASGKNYKKGLYIYIYYDSAADEYIVEGIVTINFNSKIVGTYTGVQADMLHEYIETITDGIKVTPVQIGEKRKRDTKLESGIRLLAVFEEKAGTSIANKTTDLKGNPVAYWMKFIYPENRGDQKYIDAVKAARDNGDIEKAILKAEIMPSDVVKILQAAGLSTPSDIIIIYDVEKRYIAKRAEKMKKFLEGMGDEKFELGGDFDDSEKNNNFVTRKTIQDVISGKSKVSNGEVIQATASYLRKNEGASLMGSAKPSKKETERLEDYISENNLWIGDGIIGSYISEGVEQKVYRFDSNNVIKLNTSVYYRSWESYLNSLLLHNLFFPDTAYELIGFIRRDGELNAVVKQPFIEATERTDLQHVKKLMEDNGFRNTKNNDYRNDELGIILEDLHDENVLTKDGILYFVDTVFYIDNKKFEQGGSFTQNTTTMNYNMQEGGNIENSVLQKLKQQFHAMQKLTMGYSETQQTYKEGQMAMLESVIETMEENGCYTIEQVMEIIDKWVDYKHETKNKGMNLAEFMQSLNLQKMAKGGSVFGEEVEAGKKHNNTWYKQSQWGGNPALGYESYMKHFTNQFTGRKVPVFIYGKEGSGKNTPMYGYEKNVDGTRKIESYYDAPDWHFVVSAGTHSDYSYSGSFYPNNPTLAEAMKIVDDLYANKKLIYADGGTIQNRENIAFAQSDAASSMLLHIYEKVGLEPTKIRRARLNDGWFVYHKNADHQFKEVPSDWIPDDDFFEFWLLKSYIIDARRRAKLPPLSKEELENIITEERNRTEKFQKKELGGNLNNPNLSRDPAFEAAAPDYIVETPVIINHDPKVDAFKVDAWEKGGEIKADKLGAAIYFLKTKDFRIINAPKEKKVLGQNWRVTKVNFPHAEDEALGYKTNDQILLLARDNGFEKLQTTDVENLIYATAEKIQHLECDGTVRVLHYELDKNKIPHYVFQGTIREESASGKRIARTIHYWIGLEDGRLVDFKAQMWLGKNAPNGIFYPKDTAVIYEGTPIQMEVSETVYNILLQKL